MTGTLSDYTLKGDTTYYVSGVVNLSGNTVIEGGTCIKFASGTTPKIQILGTVDCKTGPYQPDFHALATESTIVLPWDREVLVEGELVPNPMYGDALGQG